MGDCSVDQNYCFILGFSYLLHFFSRNIETSFGIFVSVCSFGFHFLLPFFFVLLRIYNISCMLTLNHLLAIRWDKLKIVFIKIKHFRCFLQSSSQLSQQRHYKKIVVNFFSTLQIIIKRLKAFFYKYGFLKTQHKTRKRSVSFIGYSTGHHFTLHFLFL